MDLWQLNVFCKVIEQKSFSKAGKTVHLSQPTVSSHIKDLETHFGTRLIDRLSREALPTKAGELLYGYAKRLLALRAETETAIAEFQGSIKGKLTVGGSTIPGNYILPEVIPGFTQAFPEVQVNLLINDTQWIVEEIANGRLELGVVGAKFEDNTIRQSVLLEDEMCLVVHKDHRWAEKRSIRIEDIFNEPFISREQGSGTLASFQSSLSKNGYQFENMNIVLSMGSNEAIRQAVKRKAGVSILSPLAISEDLKSGQLKSVRIDGLNLKRYFYLTTHSRRSSSPLGATFIKYLTDIFKR